MSVAYDILLSVFRKTDDNSSGRYTWEGDDTVDLHERPAAKSPLIFNLTLVSELQRSVEYVRSYPRPYIEKSLLVFYGEYPSGRSTTELEAMSVCLEARITSVDRCVVQSDDAVFPQFFGENYHSVCYTGGDTRGKSFEMQVWPGGHVEVDLVLFDKPDGKRELSLLRTLVTENLVIGGNCVVRVDGSVVRSDLASTLYTFNMLFREIRFFKPVLASEPGKGNYVLLSGRKSGTTIPRIDPMSERFRLYLYKTNNANVERENATLKKFGRMLLFGGDEQVSTSIDVDLREIESGFLHMVRGSERPDVCVGQACDYSPTNFCYNEALIYSPVYDDGDAAPVYSPVYDDGGTMYMSPVCTKGDAYTAPTSPIYNGSGTGAYDACAAPVSPVYDGGDTGAYDAYVAPTSPTYGSCTSPMNPGYTVGDTYREGGTGPCDASKRRFPICKKQRLS